MQKILLKPSFMIPFALVTPYVFLGQVGITWFEMALIAIFGMRFLLQWKIASRPFLIVYAFLLLIGYTIAVFNADFNFGIHAKFGDLKIFYWILLAVVGYDFGFRSKQDINTIPEARVFKLIMTVLGLFVISYPFLSEKTVELVMLRYYNPTLPPEFLKRLYSGRFPGTGINANTFSFMALVPAYFSIKAAFERRVSWIYPLLGLGIIAISGSKTVFALVLLLTLNVYFRGKLPARAKIRYFAFGLVLLMLASFFFFGTDKGQEMQKTFVILDRFGKVVDENVKESDRPQNVRFTAWKKGLQRIELAPFTGIAESPVKDDHSPVDFCCPHNEFLAYWSFTGIFGLFAYLILLSGLFFMNRKTRDAYFWNGLYLALVVQMFFDSAFQTTRFIPFMFLVIGLNVKDLNFYRLKWLELRTA